MIVIRNITDIWQHLNGLKAFIFDLDDTLYSEKEYIKSGYAAVAKVLPNVEDAETKLWKAFEEKKFAIDDVLRSENIYSEELKQKCLEVYRFHQPSIHLYDEALEILTQLRKKGFPIGIITDGRPEGQRAKIKALGLDALVDYIIITDELGGVEYRKPNEKAFVIMKDQLHVEYDEMCYVGDNINKDFIAPEKLGMKTFFINNINGIYAAVDV